MAVEVEVDEAISAALNVASVTSLATGGVHNTVAPSDAAMPFVVFQQQSEVSGYTQDGWRRIRYVYIVKAVVQSRWPRAGTAIDAACEAVLTNRPLTIDGATHVKTLREGAVRFPDPDDPRGVFHVGGVYACYVDEAI